MNELKHGWLISQLMKADHHGRWGHWFSMWALPTQAMKDPIPRCHWDVCPSTRRMVEKAMDASSKCGHWGGWSGWNNVNWFLDLLLWGCGHDGQPEPPAEEGENEGGIERVFNTFDLDRMMEHPHDYFGDILAETGHGKHNGFFPTPMPLCELMTRMTMEADNGEDTRLKSVMDPCLGTGRFLLTASNYSYKLYGQDKDGTVIKAALVNGYLYAPWLVRPFTFINGAYADPRMSRTCSDHMKEGAGRPDVDAYLADTEHDTEEQWKFEPIKKRRRKGAVAEEQGVLI